MPTSPRSKAYPQRVIANRRARWRGNPYPRPRSSVPRVGAGLCSARGESRFSFNLLADSPGDLLKSVSAARAMRGALSF